MAERTRTHGAATLRCPDPSAMLVLMDDDLEPEEVTEDELWEMLDTASGVERARILHELGGRAFSEQEFEQSVALAESAAVQAREVGDELLTARSLYGQAAGLRRLNRTQEVIDVAMEAANLLRANGEPSEIAECHAIVASAWTDLGDDVTALEHWRSAARLFESEEQLAEAGRMWMSLGEAQGRLGRHLEALDTFDHARSLFRKCDEPGAVPWADDRAAAALIDLDRADEALERLRAALHVRRAQRDNPRIAYAHYRLGWTLRLVGQFDEALSSLSIAAEMFDDLDDLEGRARCDLEAANAMTSMGQFEDAEDLYLRVRAVFDALGHDSQVILADANRAVMLARAGQTEQAAALNRDLVGRAADLGVTWLLGDIRNHLARNLLDADQPSEALEALAGRLEEEVELPAQVQAAALKARAMLALGRRAQAARAAEEGLRLAADAELVAERAELYEARGLSRLGSRSGPRTSAANRDLAHAVALYLAAGLTDKARELSKHFLPSLGTTVRRSGLFTEYPAAPAPEAKSEARSEP